MGYKQIQRKSIVFGLIIILGLIIYGTSLMAYRYYKGPMYVLDTYIKSIECQDYSKIYDILAKKTIKGLEGKDAVIKYYTRIYQKENQLLKVSKKRQDIDKVIAQYTYSVGSKDEKLEAVKENGKWRVKFPFKTYTIEVFAPIGTKVTMSGTTLLRKNAYTCYADNVLPGFAAIQAEFLNGKHKNFYKVIKVPKETQVVLPYETGTIKLSGVKGLKVSLDALTQIAADDTVCFENILTGNYTLKISHPQAIIKPILKEVNVTKNVKNIDVGQLELSDIGKEHLKDFLKHFYKAYLKDIKAHKPEAVMDYIAPENKKEIVALFNEWFVEKKDIQDVQIEVTPRYDGFNKQGEIMCYVKEEVDLLNKEYDAYEEEVIDRQYKLVLKWEVAIAAKPKRWAITKKQIQESVVAYKDDDDQWIEY